MAYCSPKCIRLAWSGGHKLVCDGPGENRLLHQVIMDLLKAELKWLQGLTLYEKKDLLRLTDMSDLRAKLKVKVAKWGEYSKVGEVALVLLNANACKHLYAYKDGPTREPFNWPQYDQQFYDDVLTPWMAKHQKILKKLGLEIKVMENTKFEVKHESGFLTKHDIDESVLVWNSRSDMKIEVEKVYLGDSNACVEWKDWFAFASYAARDYGQGTNASHVTYFFNHKSEAILGAKDLGRTACFWSTFGLNETAALGAHFRKCYLAMIPVGFKLSIRVMTRKMWTETRMAETIVAIANNNYDELCDWLKDDSFFVIDDLDEKQRIKDLALAMV